MSNLIGGLMFIGSIILGVVSVVYTLNEMGVDAQSKPSTTETNFRSVCGSVKGKTVWSGKQWECLK